MASAPTSRRSIPAISSMASSSASNSTSNPASASSAASSRPSPIGNASVHTTRNSRSLKARSRTARTDDDDECTITVAPGAMRAAPCLGYLSHRLLETPDSLQGEKFNRIRTVVDGQRNGILEIGHRGDRRVTGRQEVDRVEDGGGKGVGIVVGDSRQEGANRMGRTSAQGGGARQSIIGYRRQLLPGLPLPPLRHAASTDAPLTRLEEPMSEKDRGSGKGGNRSLYQRAEESYVRNRCQGKSRFRNSLCLRT